MRLQIASIFFQNTSGATFYTLHKTSEIHKKVSNILIDHLTIFDHYKTYLSYAIFLTNFKFVSVMKSFDVLREKWKKKLKQ